MQFQNDYHINCLTNDPQAHHAILQILSSQSDIDKEIIKYKKHNNYLKTMLIESNRQMKEKVINNISDCELRINAEYDVYSEKFSKMESRLKKDLIYLESKCDRYCFDLKTKMDDLLEKKMTKINDILDKECDEFDKKYLNCRDELNKVIVEHLERKGEELGYMMKTYKKNMKEMYNDVKNDHILLCDGLKNTYPEKFVHSMLEELCKCDIESYIEIKTIEYQRRMENSNNLINNFESKIKESEKNLARLTNSIKQENRNMVINLAKTERLKDEVIDQITSLESPIMRYDKEIRKREQYHIDSYEEEMSLFIEEITERKFHEKVGSLKKEISKFRKITTEFERNPPNKLNSKDVDRIKIKLKRDLMDGDLNKIIKEVINNENEFRSSQKLKSKQQSKKKESKSQWHDNQNFENSKAKYEKLDNSIELVSMRIKDIEDLIVKQNNYLMTTSQLCTSDNSTELY